MKIDSIYQKIGSCIKQIDASKENHVHCPAKDFTRSRKISFSDCMMSVVCMHGGTLFSEILEYFPRNMDVPTVSAYLQQRAKIKQSAFGELFNATITLHQEAKSYRGYRLLAADGSDVQIPTNPNDTDTFFPGTNGQKPYNLVHLNALYDILSNTYQDAVVQDRLKFAEHEALNQMVDRSRITRAILTADRGYESCNIMAHLQEKRWLYLIRVRDIDKGGIISRLDLPGDEEFDLDIDLQMTRKASKKTKELFEDRNHYRYIPPNSRLDYLPLRSEYTQDAAFYRIPFRVVRFKITHGQYETVVTNLSASEFPALELKKLYAMRWGIETSFRTLKYNVGMIYFHSVRKDLVLQELFSRLAFFNIVAVVSEGLCSTHSSRKYPYKVNAAKAVLICRKLFLNQISPHSAYRLLLESVIPIRKDRSFERKSHSRIAINFIYRIS